MFAGFFFLKTSLVKQLLIGQFLVLHEVGGVELTLRHQRRLGDQRVKGRVIESFSSRNSFLRVLFEHLLHEVKGW